MDVRLFADGETPPVDTALRDGAPVMDDGLERAVVVSVSGDAGAGRDARSAQGGTV